MATIKKFYNSFFCGILDMKYKYLELLEKGSITPNFWCSEEYFDKAKLTEVYDSGTWGILDQDWGLMFPLLDSIGGYFERIVEPDVDKIWSDFPEWKPKGWNSKFLDYEYIYDPKIFLHMEGGDWATFRKNCRKWPRRFGNGNLIYGWISSFSYFSPKDELSDVLISWLENKSSEDMVMDSEVLVKYLFHGQNRKILYHKNKIYGVNIWDENYKYINFRYSICRPEEFLSEHMRWLFYTDPFIQEKNKLVNDGGVLDNPKLKFFKDKMNPLQVREVYSWFKQS